MVKFPYSLRKSYKVLLIILFYSYFYVSFAETIVADSSEAFKNKVINKCLEDNAKNTLSVGWLESAPYQYQIVKLNNLSLVGLDISIINYLAQRTGYDLNFYHAAWTTQQDNIKNGTIDVALGATYSKERAEYAYFSLPYRQEENAIFIRETSDPSLDFNSTEELLTQIRIQNFRLGIVKQRIFADPLINEFINSDDNTDIVKSYLNLTECISALNKDEIDGFVSDRVAGSYILMRNAYSYNIKEIIIPSQTPVHIMFSRKTVPISIVDKFNQEIKNFVGSNTYDEMVKKYLYSNLLIQILHMKWFYVISIIGTIGFSVSGFASATKQNMSIFRSCIVAIIPSSLGLVIKDLVIDSPNDSNNFSQEYIFLFCLTGVIFCFIVLVLKILNKENEEEDSLIEEFLSNTVIVGDAIGQSCFFSVGIAVAMILKVSPSIIIPIIGIIIAHLGVAVRNIMTIGKTNLSDELNVEVTFFWSCILTYYFSYYSLQLNSSRIAFILVITIIGCFITRLLAHYLKIPNIKLSLFKKNN